MSYVICLNNIHGVWIMNKSPAQDYGLLPKTNPAHIDTTLSITLRPNITECYRA